MLTVLDTHDITGTFFTQGTVAEKFPDDIRNLSADGHLIGSHGYNHENYGGKPVNVWTDEKPLFLREDKTKKMLIQKTDSVLERLVDYKPEVFVAPFDNIDNALLSILNDLGFMVDCSFHNYTRS